jgi:hypothetical protein
LSCRRDVLEELGNFLFFREQNRRLIKNPFGFRKFLFEFWQVAFLGAQFNYLFIKRFLLLQQSGYFLCVRLVEKEEKQYHGKKHEHNEGRYLNFRLKWDILGVKKFLN